MRFDAVSTLDNHQQGDNMRTNLVVGVILIVVGIALLVMGLRAFDSFSSQFSKFFTGSPTDRAVWFTLGGIVALIAGSAMAFLPARGALK